MGDLVQLSLIANDDGLRDSSQNVYMVSPATHLMNKLGYVVRHRRSHSSI